MAARFYVPSAAGPGPALTLPPEESHHLAHVMRLDPGAAIRVFDGEGHEWHARVVTVEKRGATVALERAVAPAPEPPVAVTLGLAILKSEYMDEAVRDAVMMGVHAIQPLVTARTAVHAGDARRAALVERWQRIAVSSVKQCGRAVVPRVGPVRDYAAWVTAAGGASGLRLLLAEPSLPAGPDGTSDAWRTRPAPATAALLVGPEGGWDPREIEVARTAGFVPWTVSRRTLRADAVPVVALALLFDAWERP